MGHRNMGFLRGEAREYTGNSQKIIV